MRPIRTFALFFGAVASTVLLFSATARAGGGSPAVDVNRGPLAGRVSGAYSDTWFQFIAINLTWKS